MMSTLNTPSTQADMKKLVFAFGPTVAETEGNASMKMSLGGKGANLAEMCQLGLPVPPGFTVRAEVCQMVDSVNPVWPNGLEEEVNMHLKRVEERMGRGLGNKASPLLLSVRSGAAVSMPGMMDTILNLGLNDETVLGLAAMSSNDRFAWDSYRRLVQMFGDVALEIPKDDFEEVLDHHKKQKGVKNDTDLDADDLRGVVADYMNVYRRHGIEFPQDVKEQLRIAVTAVLKSWNNARAVKYRELNDIKNLAGTAVNVQVMVFGNLGNDSGTGVCFTRSPSDGKNELLGEYLMNAQGEDVVAGIRTPNPISDLQFTNPDAFNELVNYGKLLEGHFKDMQDIEFTIMQGKLWMLQTRNAKRTTFAFLRSNVEMVEEGLITEKQAIARMPAEEFPKLFAPILDPKEIDARNVVAITKALAASPGGATGKVVFSAHDAEVQAVQSPVILVRVETSPEDISGMAVAKGILTARGGLTSHAAVVARGMGCPCVCGASELVIDYKLKTITVSNAEVGTLVIREGDYISIDGFTGKVYADKIPVKPSEIVQVLQNKIRVEDSLVATLYMKFMAMVDRHRTLKIRANADTPRDTEMAVKFGAEGIGLVRTEHMFFDGERITAMRQMILSSTDDQRKLALDSLLMYQRADFEGIYRALQGRPCTIRVLDPPLHEFLPHATVEQENVAAKLGISVSDVAAKVEELAEVNPMMGFRGCRLAVIYPEILRMQVTAVIEAALNIVSEGIEVKPEIMIPLITSVAEFKVCRKIAEDTIKDVFARAGKTVAYTIGTMIEVPRAAITADEIAAEADFFSFGTNDLTQMTCGFSRDDAGRFLRTYVRQGIYEYDPFEVLDTKGVGKLVKLATDLGRGVKPTMKIGVCGEHGGEPKSIAFFERTGLDYVSCSPFRVPVARLAAAQAALKNPKH